MSIELEYAQLVCERALCEGFSPSLVKHNNGVSVQYGYSYIRFWPTGITARREGVGKLGEQDIVIDYVADGGESWLDQCLDILRSGRTVECGSGVGMRQISRAVSYKTVDYHLAYLLSTSASEELDWDFEPDYQRGHVWTQRQRELFLGYLLENGQMPLVFLRDVDWKDPEDKYEIVDGKQRLQSCVMFLRGEIEAELSDGRRLWWRDFNEVDRRQTPNIRCGLVDLPDRKSVLEFYLQLNRGGTMHTDEEIDRVRALLAEEERNLAEQEQGEKGAAR